MQKIPKIIHQIWSGISEPLPEYFRILSETWKEHYPEWEYMFWDNRRMNEFIRKYYPEYWDIYNKYPYNVQRWDAIRYLILDKMGGMYVDFDYESLEPLDELIRDKSSCFALEPQSHWNVFGRKKKEKVFNNALMLNVPGHFFMRKIIKTAFSQKMLSYRASKEICVLNTTGPWIISDLYCELTEEEKEDVYLIPAKHVTPFSLPQANRFRMGEISEELENCLKEAYAVHYFFSNWRNKNELSSKQRILISPILG